MEERSMNGMVTSRRTTALRNQSIGVGLMAVRARAAVKRGLSGEALTERDVSELENVKQVLARASEALRYGSTSQIAPGARQMASVGLTLSSIAPPTDELNRDQAAAFLAQLVTTIDQLLVGAKTDDETLLNEFLTRLLRTADRDTAQTGEVLVSRP